MKCSLGVVVDFSLSQFLCPQAFSTSSSSSFFFLFFYQRTRYFLTQLFIFCSDDSTAEFDVDQTVTAGNPESIQVTSLSECVKDQQHDKHLQEVF